MGAFVVVVVSVVVVAAMAEHSWEAAMVAVVVVVVAAAAVVPGLHTQMPEKTLGVDHRRRHQHHPVPFVVATWHFVAQRTCPPC